MNTADHVLRLYRLAAAVTRDILECARKADWDRVVALGQDYETIVQEIRALDLVAPLDAQHLAIKHALLVDIVQNDAATRALVVPSLHRLGVLIGNLRRQQSISQAYGQPKVVLP